MTRWIPVCSVDDIPALGSRRVARARGLDVAVFKAADQQIFALLDRCPHKGGPLSQGIVFGHSVACPLHNWSIALDSGEAAAPDQGQTPRFALKVEHGQVFLDAHELDTLATEATRPLAGPARRTCPGVTSGSCPAPAVGAR
ncbi:MAG: nitrite reductase small subunit NirD [Pseudomonadota bacterium]